MKAKTRRILSKYEIPVAVNGQKLIGYRDTGSTMSFVKERLFPTLERTGSVSIYGINDRQAVEVPTAWVKITSPIFDNSEGAVVEVGLLPHMKWQVLLGNDAFENNGLRDILHVHNKTLINSDGNDAHASATERGQNGNDGADGTPDFRNFQNGRDASQTLNDGIDTNSPQLVLRGEHARADIDETSDTAHQHSNSAGENGNRLLEAKATTRSARKPTVQRSDGSDIITVTYNDNTPTAVTVTAGNGWPHGGSNNPPAGHRDPVGGGTDGEVSSTAPAPVERDERDGAADRVDYGFNSAGQVGPLGGGTTSNDILTCDSDVAGEDRNMEVKGTRPSESVQMQADGNRDTIESTVINDNAESFRLAQLADVSLRHWFQLARAGSNAFSIKDGLLWKRKPPNWEGDNDFLLVLPHGYRTRVITTAHDSLHAGAHTSHRRTLKKIRRNFTFPRDFATVKKYCKSCETCARKSPRSVKDKTPLQPIPVVGQFGDVWQCDVLGPSLKPTARRKNRYILVCVDEATRYTQIFALRNLKGETMADVFTNQLFPRFGVPSKLVYDMQSSLTSHMFQTALNTLSVDSKIALAGYHTRTGLAERQIRQVSDILKAYIHDPEHAKNWDTILNHLAFNINQLPCRTLGFSSHELIFGINLRSELEVLKDEFLGTDGAHKAVQKDVITFMSDLQTRI